MGYSNHWNPWKSFIRIAFVICSIPFTISLLIDYDYFYLFILCHFKDDDDEEINFHAGFVRAEILNWNGGCQKSYWLDTHPDDSAWAGWNLAEEAGQEGGSPKNQSQPTHVLNKMNTPCIVLESGTIVT